jgi:hypothetical protein
MTAADWIGFFGVTILLVAFFLNLIGKITTKSFPYILLNFVGAGLACWASILLEYLPFIILEGAWTLVSFFSLMKLALTKKSPME